MMRMWYTMQEKLTADDKGDDWARARVKFCRPHKAKTSHRWSRRCQGVSDWRLFTWYPRDMKARHASKRAPRTIMNASDNDATGIDEAYVNIA